MSANTQDVKAQFAPVTFSEEGGVRTLHFGTHWVQGAMRIKKPDQIELEYAQQMMAGLLFLDPNDPRLHSKQKPFHMLQLGLGTGAITKFCHKHFPKAKVTAVDLNPAVIVAAHVMFELPYPNQQLNIVEGNALTYVKRKSHHHSTDLLQVDLYDATAQGPVLNSLEFYQGCYDTLKDTGVMTVNLFGRHRSFKTNINNICDVFNNRVLIFPEVHHCNIVALAFKGPLLRVTKEQLQVRAKTLQSQYRLPAKHWPAQLIKANQGQGKIISI